MRKKSCIKENAQEAVIIWGVITGVPLLLRMWLLFFISIMDLEGNVLYETDTKSPLENHADREEVKYAINGHSQTVERYSETFGCDMTYYALKTTLTDNTEIIVRLAVKSSQISGYFNLALPIMIVVLVVALVVSLVLAEIFSKKFSNKFVEVGDSLRSLNASCYTPIKTDSGEPELYTILNEINVLNANTHSYILRVAEEQNKLMTVFGKRISMHRCDRWKQEDFCLRIRAS